jgi:hypothetical protein
VTNATTKKITVATVKSFIRKNRDSGLLIRVTSHFNGMSDMVEEIENDGFSPIRSREWYCHDTYRYVPYSQDEPNSLGIAGVWFTRGRDSCSSFENETHKGFTVYNCCGEWTVAIAK